MVSLEFDINPLRVDVKLRGNHENLSFPLWSFLDFVACSISEPMMMGKGVFMMITM